VSEQEKPGVGGLVSNLEELITELTGGWQHPPYEVELPKPLHRGKDFRLCPCHTRQLSRSGVNLFDIRICITAHRHEWRAQGEKERQLLFVAIHALGLGLQRLKSMRIVVDGLDQGGALCRCPALSQNAMASCGWPASLW